MHSGRRTITASAEERQPPATPQVFINYYKEDSPSAQRLYSDLKAANLNPWIDKVNLLPGQNIRTEIKNVIEKSDYFVALLSKISVNSKGDVQKQLKQAKEVLELFPESRIYLLPARLDECDIPYDELRDLQHVDLFPNWEEGLDRILKAMKVDSVLIESAIKRQRNISPFVSLDVSHEVIKTQVFKGEKQFFVGRQNYINQIIKDRIRKPGSKVSIVGPGGSGKSQLAFKAMQEYVKEDIFDIVIPIYFDEGLVTFDKFLLQIAEIMGVKADDIESKSIEQRKGIIRDLLSKKKHPLIYLDNFETVSLILNTIQTSASGNDDSRSARQITDFLNNGIPENNTSILMTSREKENNLVGEYPIDLDGLNIKDSVTLFNAFVRPIFKDPKGEVKDQIVTLLRKTGGHPLSIEIIAKNLRGFHEVKDMLQSLGGLKGDPTQSVERFRTLQACFDSTIKKLDNKLQELLPKLTLFKSPFPVSAAVEILGVSENEILDLYDRSLLRLIDSDELYGRVHDSKYWLYNFHLAVRGYVEDTMRKEVWNYEDLKSKYGDQFSKYYYYLLFDTYNSIGKENHIPALARFNIICQGKENDFERAAQLTKDKQQSAYVWSYLGLVVSKLGTSSKALEYHKKALEIHKDLNDRVGMGRDYTNIGLALSDMGNYQQALEYHKKALEIDEGLNDRVGMAQDYNNIGLALSDMGNYQQALEYHKKALEIHKDRDDRVGMALDYGNIGNVLRYMDNNQQALDYHKKALEIDEGLNDRVGIAKDYNNFGNVLRNMGKYQQALDHLNKALEIHEGLNDRVGMAVDYTNIGIVLSDTGKYQQALEYHNKALEIDHGIGDRVRMAVDYTNIGAALGKMSNSQQALEYHNKALEIHTELNDKVGMADYGNIGSVLRNMGNSQQALEYHNKALEIHTELNDKVGMARDYGNIGLLLKEWNKRQEAAESVEKGLNTLLELEKETGYHHPLIETLKEKKESLKDGST